MMDLLGRSRQVVPVHMRTQKVESPLPVQSICPVSVNGVRMDSASVYKVSLRYPYAKLPFRISETQLTIIEILYLSNFIIYFYLNMGVNRKS